jgi:hypothetical protein
MKFIVEVRTASSRCWDLGSAQKLIDIFLYILSFTHGV